MNFKKTWKRANDGFTLVELIVVIAILAILAGVAVPAYSGYIKKANKGADQAVIRDVKNALELYYYSNPDEVTGGSVKLTGNGPVVSEGLDAAMVAVFGDNWAETLKLKYADWKGVSSTLSYKDSSYNGNEGALISTVDTLTTALGDVIEKDENLANTLIGDKFKGFLDEKKVNTSNGKEVGNAAVLYVAQNVKDKGPEIQNAVAAGISKGGGTPSEVADNIYNELVRTGIGDAAAMATVYAYAEGYAQATGQVGVFKPDFSGVDGDDAATDALNALGAAFDNLDKEGFTSYIQGQSTTDLQAYIDMMGTVYDNQNIVSGNLAADDCFTDGTVENMLKGHAAMSQQGITTADGEVAVVLAADGSTHVAPPNWNK